MITIKDIITNTNKKITIKCAVKYAGWLMNI